MARPGLCLGAQGRPGVGEPSPAEDPLTVFILSFDHIRSGTDLTEGAVAPVLQGEGEESQALENGSSHLFPEPWACPSQLPAFSQGRSG